MYHHHRSDFAERRREMTQSSTGNTGTRDVIYDLVSVLYHALQGAETYDQYIKDAQQREDQDLVQFFHDTKEEERRRAERVKQLLAQHLSQEMSV
jgi:rubrerythrin